MQEFHQACSARSVTAKDSIALELEDVRKRLTSTSMALNVAGKPLLPFSLVC
jgi:hypothetical protein